MDDLWSGFEFIANISVMFGLPCYWLWRWLRSKDVAETQKLRGLVDGLGFALIWAIVVVIYQITQTGDEREKLRYVCDSVTEEFSPMLGDDIDSMDWWHECAD